MTDTRSAVRIHHRSEPPSRRARLLIRLLQHLMGRTRWDLRNPAALKALRRTIAVSDHWSRYLHYQWYFSFVVQRATLNGIRCLSIQPLMRRPQRRRGVLLYLHGGGFFFRVVNSHARLSANLCAAAGLDRAYLPRYRLAPEHPYPAAVDDCLAAYRALLKCGHSSEQIVLAGDSAGGGLVLATMMSLRDCGEPLPACALLLSAVTDLTLSGPSYQANQPHDPILGGTPDAGTEFYAGSIATRDPRVSPLFGDFLRLPPMLAMVGSHERLLDDTLRLADGVRAAKGRLTIEVWNRMPHVWPILPLPESRAAISVMATFIRAQLGNPA